MKTSSFGAYKGRNSVSIARMSPRLYKGRRYSLLAPGAGLLSWWNLSAKDSLAGLEYTERYYRSVLSRLKPERVIKDLGEDAVMLCWCKAGDFCHRRVVATWIQGETGIVVPEWDSGKPVQGKLF